MYFKKLLVLFLFFSFCNKTLLAMLMPCNLRSGVCALHYEFNITNRPSAGTLARELPTRLIVTREKQLAPGFVLNYKNFFLSAAAKVKIADSCIKIDTSKIKIQNPACNDAGAISGIVVETYQNENYSCVWTDQNLDQVASTLDVSNLLPGKYTLTVTGMVTGCSSTYGPITLQNTNGPQIDESNVIIKSTVCGAATGAITNISVASADPLTYTWINEQQQIVGSALNLINQPGGTYELRITDNKQCGTVFTTSLIIPETNGIKIDTSALKITRSGCRINNGSITGLKVTGATQYQWKDASNKVVGTVPDLRNAGPGNYTFTASNGFGCIATTKAYTIKTPAIFFPDYPSQVSLPCYHANNGSIVVAVDTLAKSERWVNSSGETIGTGAALLNVAPGTYQFYLTDKNGCESLYNSYNMPLVTQLTITEGSETITNDECGLNTGSITGIRVTGGAPPYAYSWTDASNHIISTNINLTGVGQGVYTLTVSDTSACGQVSAVYIVQNQNNTILPPSVNNLQVCGPGDILLRVNDASAPYSYRLYTSETSDTAVDVQVSGNFKITVNANTAYYVSRLLGNCESARAEVRVTLGLTSADIANTFTPNNDGINDFWVIKGINAYPNAVIQIFNVYSQKVFESRGYSSPFDGTFNGKKLPSGVYYYIINLKANCSLIAGSLTIIR